MCRNFFCLKIKNKNDRLKNKKNFDRLKNKLNLVDSKNAQNKFLKWLKYKNFQSFKKIINTNNKIFISIFSNSKIKLVKKLAQLYIWAKLAKMSYLSKFDCFYDCLNFSKGKHKFIGCFQHCFSSKMAKFKKAENRKSVLIKQQQSLCHYKNIYQYDELNRREFVLNMVDILLRTKTNQNGKVFLLNGQFGSGKSTVINFLEKELGCFEEFQFVRFDSWKNNFFQNPLLALLYSLTNLQTIGDKIKKEIVNIGKNIPKALLDTIESKVGIDLRSLFLRNNIFEQYKNYQKAILHTKSILKKSSEKKTIVMCIDELDRCLPEYQIQMLENIHFLLNVPNLIVLISIDKFQLEKIIENKFGNNNVYGYMAKFIDYEFELPNSSDSLFYEKLLAKHGITEGVTLIVAIIENAGLSVREGMKIINEMNLCFVFPETAIKPWYQAFIVFLLVLKHKEFRLYKKFFLDKLSIDCDEEVQTLEECIYEEFELSIKKTSLANMWGLVEENAPTFKKVLMMYLDGGETVEKGYEHDIKKDIDFENEDIEIIKSELKTKCQILSE